MQICTVIRSSNAYSKNDLESYPVYEWIGPVSSRNRTTRCFLSVYWSFFAGIFLSILSESAVFGLSSIVGQQES